MGEKWTCHHTLSPIGLPYCIQDGICRQGVALTLKKQLEEKVTIKLYQAGY